MYIYLRSNWPKFTWNREKVLKPLLEVKFLQGLLLGKMESLGFNLKEEAVLDVLTQDILKSSEVEGEILNKEQVRSSVARRLGINAGGIYTKGLINIDRDVEGIVEMMLDATQHYDRPLTKDRLFGWHASLFPTGYSGMYKIEVGRFRDDKNGSMQVVSGPVGKKKIHYQAPDASVLDIELTRFLDWINRKDNHDVLSAGIAHLWFVTIHPFDDGNGRIARAITDMLLAESERTSQRFYSMSAQIMKERNAYYDILEKTQKKDVDITGWLVWFLKCLRKAIENAEETLSTVLDKAHFWQKYSEVILNDRQKKVLNRFLDGFEGNLTSSKWAKISKSSQDSANRDISYLLEKNMLIKKGSGRNTHYILNI